MDRTRGGNDHLRRKAGSGRAISVGGGVTLPKNGEPAFIRNLLVLIAVNLKGYQRLARWRLAEMVEILALVLHHDEQAVLVAVELALEQGVPSKTHILHVLHRLLDGKPGSRR